jgi:hypothetical protein
VPQLNAKNRERRRLRHGCPAHRGAPFTFQTSTEVEFRPQSRGKCPAHHRGNPHSYHGYLGRNRAASGPDFFAPPLLTVAPEKRRNETDTVTLLAPARESPGYLWAALSESDVTRNSN